MATELDLLREMIRNEFANMNRQFDAQCDLAEERHIDIKNRLTVIESDVKDVKKENGQAALKLAHHEQKIDSLAKKEEGLDGKLWRYGTLLGLGGWIVWVALKAAHLIQ